MCGNNIILYVLDGVTYRRLWFPCTFFKIRSDFDNRNEIEKVTWLRMLLNLKSAMNCEVSVIWSWNTVDLSESLEPWLVAILQMKPTRAIYRFVSVPGTTVKPIRDIRWPASSAYIYPSYHYAQSGSTPFVGFRTKMVTMEPRRKVKSRGYYAPRRTVKKTRLVDLEVMIVITLKWS